MLQLVLGPVETDPRVRKMARAVRDAGYPVVYLGTSPRGVVEGAELDGIPDHSSAIPPGIPYDGLLESINAKNPLYRDHPRVKASLRAAVSEDGHDLTERLRTLALLPPYGALQALRTLGVVRTSARAARNLWIARLVDQVRRFRPRLIHAHDLDAFRAVAHLGRMFEIPVIYDSHELERGRNMPTWSRLDREIHALSERITIRYAARVITVAPSIATVLAREHGIERPLVVVNSPPRKNVRENAPLRVRLGLPAGHRVLLYLGGITAGRGLPLALEALRHLPPTVHFAIFGPVSRAFEDEWRSLLASYADVRERLHVRPSVPYEDVIHEAYGADLGFNGIEPVCESYRHALPNKFFEYVFADVPVATTPAVDVEALVGQYQLGAVFPHDDLGRFLEIARAACAADGTLEIPPDSRARFVERFCWEAQEADLVALYRELLGTPRGS